MNNDLADALESTYVAHWARMRSARVMRRTVDLLKRELADTKLTDVSTKSLRAHCERWLTGGKAPATVNRRMAAVGVVLGRAVEDGLLQSRPKLPHYAENNTKDRYMKPEEERAVLGWLVSQGEAHSDWRYVHDLAVFLLDTGVRFSEAFTFEIDNGCAVLSNGTTKSGDGRRVPLTARARAAAEALTASPAHSRLQAMVTRRRSWDWVSHRWQRAVKATGCPDVTLHILRHTCASRLVQKGIPIYTVSKWLGHSSVKITERYAKLAPDSLAGALAALEP
jgi:integrase